MIHFGSPNPRYLNQLLYTVPGIARDEVSNDFYDQIKTLIKPKKINDGVPHSHLTQNVVCIHLVTR
jgi:hypothetical protein